MAATSGCFDPNTASRILRARFKRLLCLHQVALKTGKDTQIVERAGDEKIVGPVDLFQDGHGSTVEYLSLGGFALDTIRVRKVAQAGGNVGMLWSENLLSNRQGTLKERFERRKNSRPEIVAST